VKIQPQREIPCFIALLYESFLRAKIALTQTPGLWDYPPSVKATRTVIFS
jgi:hypothetical protein